MDKELTEKTDVRTCDIGDKFDEFRFRKERGRRDLEWNKLNK